jgi:hypothetical protein
MTKFSGQLPKELEGIIREYSRPRLSGELYDVYHDMLRTWNLTRWPELAKKLAGTDGQQMLAVAKVFLVAQKGFRHAAFACEQGYGDAATMMRDLAVRRTWADMLGPANDALLTMVFGETPDSRWWWTYSVEEW